MAKRKSSRDFNMNYTYEIFKWQKRSFIQEFQNDKEIPGNYVSLSSVVNTNNTYFKGSELHLRIRKWLKENHPELLI